MKKEKNKSETTPNRVKGLISINSRGVGYLVNDTKTDEDDLEIENNLLKTALNGDEVEAIIHPKVKGRRLQGEVVSIIKRVKTQFVGTLDLSGQNFFLVPDDRKMYIDIFIPAGKTMGGKSGEKVLVEMVSWKDRKKSPEGKVLKVLGKKGEHEVEMQSIVLEKGFDTDFPEAVVREAENIEKTQKEITAAETSSRRDFRGVFTCTIDPVDAKDFDDALSFQKLPNGNFEVGVHIADVSHYVQPGSELDKEARKRGFSVYLVDRTIPMLPHALSNDICSLNPNEDKLTFSAVFELTPNAEVKNSWFGRTIIHSDKRFAYEEAQEVLSQKSGPASQSLGGASQHFEALNTLNRVAKILKKQKTSMGAIDFEQDEVKFVLDQNGKPIEVIKKSRLDTHKLVEEFMLLANREVAKFIHKAAKEKYQNRDISIYRIHDLPDKEKIAELSIFLKALGYELPITDKKISPKDIQALLNQVEGKAEESLIKTATIRSMAKAIYSTKNIGHFGLAFDYYTHFTSPIRRYPDLLVHRILFDILEGRKISPDQMAYYYKVSDESTRREIAAADAERTSIKYKQVEYMSEHVGEIYDGIISGVTDWGIYVEEVTTKSEGMVRLKDLRDDFYTFDQKNYAIVGQKNKKKYTLGDKVKIEVKGADLEKRTLDYRFVE